MANPYQALGDLESDNQPSDNQPSDSDALHDEAVDDDGDLREPYPEHLPGYPDYPDGILDWNDPFASYPVAPNSRYPREPIHTDQNVCEAVLGFAEPQFQIRIGQSAISGSGLFADAEVPPGVEIYRSHPFVSCINPEIGYVCHYCLNDLIGEETRQEKERRQALEKEKRREKKQQQQQQQQESMEAGMENLKVTSGDEKGADKQKDPGKDDNSVRGQEKDPDSESDSDSDSDQEEEGKETVWDMPASDDSGM
ncbi:hypothetical protein B0T19DRAFT_442862 [Cercophora scortea]|uniref:Uncharacterized protein n=1 Tax=Cercophora scortea TaxID=314031 RepID=A0AAE0IE09_9PEZI|nr:hypothetical protein B0T19DRAFT_442862 [Cercophora scortea]